MKKKYLLLALSLVCVLAVSMLGGCACGKKSNFAGTWVETKDYGEASNSDEAKFIGAYGEGDIPYIEIYADHTIIVGAAKSNWSLDPSNSNRIIAEDDSSGFEFSYDQGSDSLIIERYYFKYTLMGEAITSDYRRLGEYNMGSAIPRYKNWTKMVLNSNGTGTYDNKDITWTVSSDNGVDMVIISTNTVGSSDIGLVYDKEKDRLERNVKYKNVSSQTIYERQK